MSNRPIRCAFFALCAAGLICSNAQGQVVFSSIEDFSGSNANTSVGLQSCFEESPDIAIGASTASGTSTCTSGSGEFVTTATSAFSGLFTGDALDVAGASLSAQLEVEADANPLNNLGSKSSSASSNVRMNFNALSPVRYRVTLSASVNSGGFSQLGEDKASVTLANTGFAAFETLSVEQNPGSDTQTAVREGILPAGTFFLSVSTTGSANAPFAADAATASATLEVTFEPVLSGGCCIDDSCSQLSREECAAQSGVYAGDNEACVDCTPEVVSCDLTWAEATSGNFSSASNWSPEDAPSDNGAGCNNLFFNLPGTYTVNFGTSAANALFARDGNVEMSGTRLALSGRAPEGGSAGPLPPALGVGNGAVLFLSGGEIAADTAVIGDLGTGTSSRITVSGEGARLNVENGLLVGDVMDGTLTITDNGQVDSGDGFVGALAVENGVGSDVLINTGGQWTTAGLTVGLLAPGSITLRGGSMVSIAATLGANAGIEGEMLVAEEDSGWRVAGPATIGGEGVGILTIEDLGVVSVDSMIVGGAQGGSGTITVRGANAILERADLRVEEGDLVLGNGGDGSLSLLEGGHLLVVGDFVVGADGELATFVADGAENGVNAGMAILGHLHLGKGSEVAQGLFDNGATGATGTATIGDGASGQLLIRQSGRFVVQSNEEGTHFGILNIGSRGPGVITVESGGELEADGISLGLGGDGRGVLTVRDATVTTTRLGITIGDSGDTASLELEGASLVQSASELFVGASGGAATVTLTGDATDATARIVVPGLLGIGLAATESSVTLVRNATLNAGEIIVGGLAPGLLSILENSVVTAPTTTVRAEGLLIGEVSLPNKQADGADTPNLVGDLIVEAGGRVRISAGVVPAIRVSGNATLGGTLEVGFEDEAGLTAGNTISLLRVDGDTTGEFAEVTFPTRSAEFDGDLSLENGELVLAVNNPGTPLGGEGEGEGETPGGCNAAKTLQPVRELVGDWVTALFGVALLLGSAMLGRPGTL